jgi:hypothetical protein
MQCRFSSGLTPELRRTAARPGGVVHVTTQAEPRSGLGLNELLGAALGRVCQLNLRAEYVSQPKSLSACSDTLNCKDWVCPWRAKIDSQDGSGIPNLWLERFSNASIKALRRDSRNNSYNVVLAKLHCGT